MKDGEWGERSFSEKDFPQRIPKITSNVLSELTILNLASLSRTNSPIAYWRSENEERRDI